MVRSPPLTEKHPEHCHRSDQRDESQERTCHCRNVCRSHQIVEAIEALLQRQCQQETGEQLHTGLCDSQLLKQAGPVAVEPLRFSFGARPVVPFLIALGMVDIHAIRHTRPASVLLELCSSGARTTVASNITNRTLGIFTRSAETK
jgi:hypothetical protein